MTAPDWRQSYQATLVDERDSLIALRERCITGNVYRPIFFGEQTISAARLTNDQIDRISIRRAEQTVQRAIHQWNENENRRRDRRGEAR